MNVEIFLADSLSSSNFAPMYNSKGRSRYYVEREKKKEGKDLPIYERVRYLRNTRISFSKESSFPFKAFLSIIFTAYISPGFSLLSAKRTSEKAPLWKKHPCIYCRLRRNYST